jgi:DNA polymerase-1
MRSGVKTIDFGLAYGMSKFKLSASMKIDLKAAEGLIEDYFREFPRIGRTLRQLGMFGVTNGYIQTLAPFFRKRWFPYWKYARNGIDAHIKDVQYDSTLGSIERASKNMPIQGTSADMTKTAIWLIFEYIHAHGLSDRVKLVMQVHDQLTTRVREDYAMTWKPILHDLMLQAGKFSIPNGLLGADTNITKVWSK